LPPGNDRGKKKKEERDKKKNIIVTYGSVVFRGYVRVGGSHVVRTRGLPAFLAPQCERAFVKASPSPRGLSNKRAPLTKKGLLKKDALLVEGFRKGEPFCKRAS
jgi:hypothetical protein